MNPLITTVLDLDAALGGNAGLLLGGGLGLYLKQEYLRTTGARTLLPFDRLPQARTTQDIDLFLRAEVIADEESVARYRDALNSLGFVVVPDAKWLKFARDVGGTEVLLDIMVGPLGEHVSEVNLKEFRVRPKQLDAKDGLHARLTEDALGIERDPTSLTLNGSRNDGSAASCEVLIPRPFPYALMKLGALRDRINDEDKQEGRHHAMDLYRIVGMLTEEDEAASVPLAIEFADSDVVVEALRTIKVLLAPNHGKGRIRLIEYQRMNASSVPEVDADFLVTELYRLLVPPA
jgi:hypothetical protein